MAPRKYKKKKVSNPTSTDFHAADTKRHSSLSVFPIEILLEILSYARPIDLLHVAQSNKWLRNTLMSRRTTSLWKSVIKNIDGLPECPSNMCDARYTSLMFEPWCENCDNEGLSQIIWQDRTRLCSRCKDNLYYKSKPRPPKEFDGELWKEAMDDIATLLSQYGGQKGSATCKGWYKPTIFALRETLPSLSEDDQNDHLEQLLMKRKDTGQWDKAEYISWARHRFVQALKRKKREEEALQKQREKDHAQIRSRRIPQILDHLERAGFKKELSIPDVRRALNCHQVVQLPQEFTTSEWIKIERPLSDHIGELMSNIESHKRKNALIGRFSALISILDEMKDELPNIHPNRYIDIILMPQVREVLDLPPDKSVTSAAMARLREFLPSIWAQWKNEISAIIARENYILLPIFAALGTLDHPAVILTCMNCCYAVLSSYDGLFAHCCHGEDYTPRKFEKVTSAIDGSVYEHAAKIACKRTQWQDDLKVCREPERVLELMHACGVDPNRTTWEGMDRLSVRLVCVKCYSKGWTDPMDWRAAVKHSFDRHGPEKIKWRIAVP